MKKAFLLAVAVLFTALAGAQDKEIPGDVLSPELNEYLMALPQRAAFNSHFYEFLPVRDTPAPAGFKPFYISHYGRHGSRSDLGDGTFIRVRDCLQAGADEGILTPAGEELLAYTLRIIELHGGMEGRLTERGAHEHEQLAERMYKRFKPVFRNGEVHALSSESPRALVSMAAFTSSLKACKGDLAVTWDCGAKYQRFLTRNSSEQVKKAADAMAWSSMTAVPVDTLAIFRSFFTDPARGMALIGKPRRLISGIFTIASYAPAYGVNDDLFRFLPWDAVVAAYRRHALNAYLAQCNSVPFGDQRMPRAGLLAAEIVRRADEAIAGAPVAADLRFGHDWPFLGICSYFGLEGYGYPRLTAEEAARSWNGPKLCPFAANLQLVFYRNRKGDVLVKFLANEQETPIPELDAYSGPYYRWEDVKTYIKKYDTD